MRIGNVSGKILNNEAKNRLLRVFCRDFSEWTGRQLAKEVDISPTTASKFLRELTKEGVLKVKAVGKANLYSVNRENYIVSDVLVPFFEKERNVRKVITSLIRSALRRSGANITASAIFGSVARKEESDKSDIDLLVVVKNAKDHRAVEYALDKLAPLAAKKFQTAISPFILSEQQIRKKYRLKSPIIREILGSYIPVMGAPVEKVVA